jgi:hypothetical protein
MAITPHAQRSADLVAALLRRFEDGSIAEPLQTSIIMQHSDDPLSDRPMLKWSFLNQISVMCSGTMDARGPQQWKKAGRHMKKGSRAVHILAPVFRSWWEDEKYLDLDPENPTTSVAEKTRKVKRQVLVGFKTIPVFRYEDTQAFPGEPEHLEQWDYTPPTLPPMTEFASRLGITTTYHPHSTATPGQLGTYNTRTETDIDLYEGSNQTFFHELSHALHQRVLSARDVKIMDVPKEMLEVVAETAATVISSLYDEDYSGTCYRYLQQHVEGKDTKAILFTIGKVMEDVKKIVEIVLDAGVSTETGVAAVAALDTSQHTSATATA